ncbi:MAG: AAA family ATPase, partial [Caedimonadaceae bacterium]
IMRSVGKPPLGRMIFKYFFEEVYLFAKYELYRQMALKHSGDSRLYDAKRLIYSLLIVSLENRFSNTLIRNRALELIFAPYKEDRNAIWPTGQQVAMSKDGLMIVSDNECVCDLLGCDYLSKSLLNFMTELKCIYDGYSRTKRVVDGKITGWYPVHQRDQTPKSWTTALTLSFIKKFCKLVSLELSRKAKEKFRSNYRKTKIDWHEIYDCTAVKAKIRLMFPEGDILSKRATGGEIDILQDCKYRTAILFGPPGTGKTTYGRGIAAKLELDYLELTPGDFFAGGEDSILVSINDIFEHLLHLKNTVVFIDEIDDLVKDRNPIVKDKIENSHQPYDPRTLFVNSLLPRFQELHDQGNIILLMATNNIERVDKAITRMGRVDLVIPVGSISPHGRLKYIQKIIDNNNDVFNGLLRVEPETKLSILIDYLNATEGFNYGTLKHYCEVVIDEIRKIDSKYPIVICEEIVKRFNAQAKRKAPNNPMWIWKDDVIEKNRDNDYDTRPRHTEGDFYDFGHFDVREGGPYPISKKEFQEKFVYLYYYLNVHNNYASSADTIQQIINNYCNDFPINEKGETRMFKERLYNIMTPFYDDIESAIKKVDAADKRTKNKLLRSKDQIGDLIFG